MSEAKPKHRVFIVVTPVRRPSGGVPDGPIDRIDLEIYAGPPNVETPSCVDCNRLASTCVFAGRPRSNPHNLDMDSGELRVLLEKAVYDAVQVIKPNERLLLALKRAIDTCRKTHWNLWLAGKYEPFMVIGEDDPEPTLFDRILHIQEQLHHVGENSEGLTIEQRSAYAEVHSALGLALEADTKMRAPW